MDGERIKIGEGVQAGKPIIRGTRLTVEFVLGLLATGWSNDDIVDSYPGVEFEDVKACLAYARQRLAEAQVLPLSV